MSRHVRIGDIRVDNDTDAFTFDLEFQDNRPEVFGEWPLIRARVFVPVEEGETSAEPARERAHSLQQSLRRIL